MKHTNHRKQPRNTPNYLIYLPCHTKPLTLSISLSVTVFIYYLVPMWYQRCLIAQDNEHPHTLRKHAYSNIQKISPPKTENFQIKNSDIFHISAQNIDCGYSLEPSRRLWYSLEPPRRGGCNEYPQSMFLSRNKKNNVYPCKPQFYYKKWGLRGSKLYRYVFLMVWSGSLQQINVSEIGWSGLLQKKKQQP